MKAFQCDITYDKLTMHVCEGSIDIVTVIFVLSSISPEKMLPALANIATVSNLLINIVYQRCYFTWHCLVLRVSENILVIHYTMYHKS